MSVLQDLLAATPAPPIDVDVDTMLAMFEAMHAQRAEILGSVPAISVTTDDDRAIVAAIAERQLAWLSALEATRDRVRAQRIATTKLRHYADAVG
jgi:hypothetical protein